MTPDNSKESIRQAASNLQEILNMMNLEDPLNGAELVILYRWLSDNETLSHTDPIRKIFYILFRCIERQKLDPSSYKKLQALIDEAIHAAIDDL